MTKEALNYYNQVSSLSLEISREATERNQLQTISQLVKQFEVAVGER